MLFLKHFFLLQFESENIKKAIKEHSDVCSFENKYRDVFSTALMIFVCELIEKMTA